jgi:arylsulfatase
VRAALVAAVCGALALPGCDARDARSGDPRPNVVLIVVDTLRADFLGAYGYDGGTSPNLDTLAARSVVFDRAVAASALTAPSHASIMTSRYVREHSIGYLNGGTRLVGRPTLASVFRDAGYDTAAFISNSIIRRRVGLDAGFDVYDDALPDSERNRPYAFERTAEATTDRAVEWLRRDATTPFFLWVHYQDPHGPYTPPDELVAEFDRPPDPSERPLPVLDGQSGHRGIPAYQALPGLRYASQYRARYAAEIRYFDQALARLLEAIDTREGEGGTVLLLTADHGESMGEGQYFFAHGHATTPDLVRVPFILCAPGLAAGRNAGLVHHVDVMPTLLDLAGLPLPPGLRGLALGPLVGSGRDLPDRVVFSDDGDDVSAYGIGRFVRVSQRGREVDGETGGWTAFRWLDDGRWTPTPLDTAERAEIVSYLETRTPMVEADPLEPADVERLRALGYVEPE